MQLTRRKLLGAVIGGVALATAIVAALLDDLRPLLLVVVVIQIGGFAGVAMLVGSVHRRIDRRLTRFEQDAATVLAEGIEHPSFMEAVRSAAIPQEHLEQLLRTIEAGNARLETAQDQLAARVDRAIGKDHRA